MVMMMPAMMVTVPQGVFVSPSPSLPFGHDAADHHSADNGPSHGGSSPLSPVMPSDIFADLAPDLMTASVVPTRQKKHPRAARSASAAIPGNGGGREGLGLRRGGNAWRDDKGKHKQPDDSIHFHLRSSWPVPGTCRRIPSSRRCIRGICPFRWAGSRPPRNRS